MLWLALYLPQFPLEISLRGAVAAEPVAVSARQGSAKKILLCNAPASAFGIQPGMAVAAAEALAPNLHVHARDAQAEASLLSNLAVWAEQFTPSISVVDTRGLLLEIEGSAHLFGGVRKLAERARLELNEMGYSAIAACAPTPAGAWLFSCASNERFIRDGSKMERALSRLSIDILGQPPATLQSLHAIGIDTIGDCLALPRDGLTRRFGKKLLDEIDRATGKLPDPRRFFIGPPHFESVLELPADVENTEALLFASRRLLLEFEGFLRGRASGVQEFCLACLHQGMPATRIVVGLVSPNGNSTHLFTLLRERLERIQLPAPVRCLVLSAERIVAVTSQSLSLFGSPQEDAENANLLVERLQARLGHDAVKGICTVADHRPELAWRATKPNEAAPSSATGSERPNWLLPEPKPLKMRKGKPYWEGTLSLASSPERIESGWWDDAPVSRDYYVAEAVTGSRLWVYREPNGNWYLHGVFS